MKMPKASDSYLPIFTYLLMQEPDLPCTWATKTWAAENECVCDP